MIRRKRQSDAFYKARRARIRSMLSEKYGSPAEIAKRAECTVQDVYRVMSDIRFAESDFGKDLAVALVELRDRRKRMDVAIIMLEALLNGPA